MISFAFLESQTITAYLEIVAGSAWKTTLLYAAIMFSVVFGPLQGIHSKRESTALAFVIIHEILLFIGAQSKLTHRDDF